MGKGEFTMKSFDGDESGVFLMERRVGDESGEFGYLNSEGKRDAEARAWLKKLRDLPPVRLAKVLKIREQIAKGSYETPERWNVAIDRLLEEIR
jgi:hypothetical protein